MRKFKYGLAAFGLALVLIFSINMMFFRTEIYNIPIYENIRITVDGYCEQRNVSSSCEVFHEGGIYSYVQSYTINHGLNRVIITYKDDNITKKATINFADKRNISIRALQSSEVAIEVR